METNVRRMLMNHALLTGVSLILLTPATGFACMQGFGEGLVIILAIAAVLGVLGLSLALGSVATLGFLAAGKGDPAPLRRVGLWLFSLDLLSGGGLVSLGLLHTEAGLLAVGGVLVLIGLVGMVLRHVRRVVSEG